MSFTGRMLLLAVVLAVVAAGCGDDDTPAAGPSTTSEPGDSTTSEPSGTEGDVDVADRLADRQFWSSAVTEDGSERELVEGTRVQIGFADGTISASAGCNSMGGSFEIDDDGYLVVGELASTQMGCDPDRHEQDGFVAELLLARPLMELQGDRLTLRTDTVTLDMIDRKVADPNRPVIGTRWEITGFVSIDATTAFNIAVPGWLEFDADSTLRGFDGCTEFTRPVEVSDGSTGGPIEGDAEMQYGERDPALDIAACGDDADYAAAVELAFATREATMTLDGSTALLVNRDGNGLTLRAIDEPPAS